MPTVRIVHVVTGELVSFAEYSDSGQLLSAEGDTAQAVVENTARDQGLAPADAVAATLRDGWSNGYLMVALT